MSLATKYRPKDFGSVVEQTSTKRILQQQVDTGTFGNTYLFCGPSGDGKTTIARIFAGMINHGLGEPIEIDGASNNGVDNVRSIIDDAKARALDAEYKTFIIDECHAITNAGWNAFLKCLEEPPKYTIFIFCTTDPQKIPATITNRLMRFNLTKISTEGIRNRLEWVCSQEGYSNFQDACDLISKMANGGMRDGLALLEKCAGYSKDLSIQNVLQAIGNFSYETYFRLVNALVDNDKRAILSIVDEVYDSGKDIKMFIEQFLEFCLDLDKYCLFKDISITKIPAYLEKPKERGDTMNVAFAVGFDGSTKFFGRIVSRLLELKVALKYDTMPKTTASIRLMEMSQEGD